MPDQKRRGTARRMLRQYPLAARRSLGVSARPPQPADRQVRRVAVRRAAPVMARRSYPARPWRRPPPNFADGFPTDLVVWARFGSYPWWPSVVVDRSAYIEKYEASPSLPVPTNESRMVKFFNDGNRVAVLECEELREYTTNRKKVQKVTDADEYLQSLLAACEEAHEYIKTDGLSAQKESFENNPYTLPDKLQKLAKSFAPVGRNEVADKPKKKRRLEGDDAERKDGKRRRDVKPDPDSINNQKDGRSAAELGDIRCGLEQKKVNSSSDVFDGGEGHVSEESDDGDAAPQAPTQERMGVPKVEVKEQDQIVMDQEKKESLDDSGARKLLIGADENAVKKGSTADHLPKTKSEDVSSTGVAVKKESDLPQLQQDDGRGPQSGGDRKTLTNLGKGLSPSSDDNVNEADTTKKLTAQFDKLLGDCKSYQKEILTRVSKTAAVAPRLDFSKKPQMSIGTRMVYADKNEGKGKVERNMNPGPESTRNESDGGPLEFIALYENLLRSCKSFEQENENWKRERDHQRKLRAAAQLEVEKHEQRIDDCQAHLDRVSDQRSVAIRKMGDLLMANASASGDRNGGADDV